ncbi:hypothetical protein QQF64_023433 [Cirrhinus molitorella]|uniref:Transmembrane protein n=1 Tax=Cirrhinus molitorella TaxID=172907 RepID=A0ABR3L5C6_9TELE
MTARQRSSVSLFALSDNVSFQTDLRAKRLLIPLCVRIRDLQRGNAETRTRPSAVIKSAGKTRLTQKCGSLVFSVSCRSDRGDPGRCGSAGFVFVQRVSVDLDVRVLSLGWICVFMTVLVQIVGFVFV